MRNLEPQQENFLLELLKEALLSGKGWRKVVIALSAEDLKDLETFISGCSQPGKAINTASGAAFHAEMEGMRRVLLLIEPESKR
jgi:hypothetical protein